MISDTFAKRSSIMFLETTAKKLSKFAQFLSKLAKCEFPDLNTKILNYMYSKDSARNLIFALN